MQEPVNEPQHLPNTTQALKPTLKINTRLSSHLNAQEEPTAWRMNSPKRRLQIFKGYNPRLASSDCQDEETVIINPRKYTYSSGDFQEDLRQKCQRQSEVELKQSPQQLHKDRDSTKTNRRHIFVKALQSPKRPPNQQLSKTNSQESLIPTQRLRQNIENALSCSRFKQIDRPPLLQTRSQISPIKFAYSSLQRQNTVQNKNVPIQFPINLTSTNLSSPSQVPTSTIISPKKITFTYQPTQFSVEPFRDQKQIVPPPISPNPPTPKYSQRPQVKAATVNYLEMPSTKSFMNKYGSSQLSDQFNPTGSKAKKSIFLSNQRETHQKTLQNDSWGNRIRTELMGLKPEEKSKVRKDVASKTTLVNCKESVIVGSKVNRNNLKINQSFSNISDNQSSKRYYDEDFQFLPQLKKISYNNIDISREDSFEEHEEDFKPNELFIDFHGHTSDLQPGSPSRIRDTYHRAEKQKPIAQKPILEQLVHQIKQVEKPEAKSLPSKLLPLVLIVLASLLLLIQVSI